MSASHLQRSTNNARPCYEPCLCENPTETSNLLTPQLPPKQTHFGTWVIHVIYARQQFHNTTRSSLHYRKPVWAKLKSTAYEGLTGKMYTSLPATAAQACLQSRSLGVAKLRLLPKKTGQSYAKPGALTLSSYYLCAYLKHMHLTLHTCFFGHNPRSGVRQLSTEFASNFRSCPSLRLQL